MRVPFDSLKTELKRVLSDLSFPERKAETCAQLFASNSLDGVYSHGLNRFPVFVQLVREGWIDVKAEPTVLFSNGIIEDWDGNSGAGPYNAFLAMQRAISLAKQQGMGLVTLRNTNHWMRGGSYGWQAADAGCIGICTTNTIANMPPWGGREARLGNNPFVIAVPYAPGHVVLDMAVSQYSYGALQEYERSGKQLPVPGGYDAAGQLTTDAAAIYRSQRVLPVGFWKGSGLSMVIDILLTALTGGRSVSRISDGAKETGVTQLFICIQRNDMHEALIREIIAFTKSSAPAETGGRIGYPGEQTLITRNQNLSEGIPVHEDTWKQVLNF